MDFFNLCAKMKKYLLIGLFASAAVTFSCKKDDATTATPTPTPPTKAQILSEKAWQVNSAYMVKTTGDTLKNVTIQGSDTWRIKFNTDSTGTLTGTILGTGNFTWLFTNTDKTIVKVTKGSNNLNYTFPNDSTLNSAIPNLKVYLVNSSNVVVDSAVGVLHETYTKVK
jgi:hypothetical protein